MVECHPTSLNPKPIWDQHPILDIATDFYIVGGRAFWQGGSSLYVNWIIKKPEQHINIKEPAMIKIAVCHWVPMVQNQHLAILKDIFASCRIINKGYSSNHVAVALLKYIR